MGKDVVPVFIGLTRVLAVCGSRLDDKIEKLIQKRKAEWGKDGELLPGKPHQ